MDLFSHRGPARARAWRWCVQPTFGGPPEGRRQRGGLPEPAALAGLRTKPGVVAPTAPRAELHRAADHHGPERLSPAPNPNKHENGSAWPPAGPLSRPLAGQLQPEPPPPLCAWSPPPPSPSSPQLSPSSRLQRAWAHKAGRHPCSGGGEY